MTKNEKWDERKIYIILYSRLLRKEITLKALMQKPSRPLLPTFNVFWFYLSLAKCKKAALKLHLLRKTNQWLNNLDWSTRKLSKCFYLVCSMKDEGKKPSDFYCCYYYSRVWNKRTPLNKRSPLENLAKRIIVALFFTLYYEVRNKAVAPGKKSKN